MTPTPSQARALARRLLASRDSSIAAVPEPELTPDLIEAIKGHSAFQMSEAFLSMEERKDGAYRERNQVVALLARMALALGWKAGVARTAIEGWDPEWHGCVYVDLPNGQASWHFHDDHAYLFAGLPAYTDPWDQHDTVTKYQRVEACQPGIAAVPV